MDYVEAVTAAAGALKRGEEALWVLARLTCERTYAAGNVAAQGATGRVAIAQWSVDVMAAGGRKFGTETARIYREIWVRFGSEDRTKLPSWTDAYYAVVPHARPEATRERSVNKHLEEATPERKRELLIRLLHDPALATVATLDQVAALLTARRREVRGLPPSPEDIPLEEREAAANADPYRVSAMLRLAMCLLDGRAAARDAAEALRRCLPLTPERRALVRTDLARVVDLWQQLDALVEGGAVLGEIEQFLAAHRAAAEQPAEDVAE